MSGPHDDPRVTSILVNPANPVPPYEQIRAQIAARIAAGQVTAGAPLPSVRQLARDLGVAPNTIARAYEELERAGWIIAEPRKGFSAAVHPPAVAAEERMRRLRSTVAELLMAAHQLGVSVTELHEEIDRQTSGLQDTPGLSHLPTW